MGVGVFSVNEFVGDFRHIFSAVWACRELQNRAPTEKPAGPADLALFTSENQKCATDEFPEFNLPHHATERPGKRRNHRRQAGPHSDRRSKRNQRPCFVVTPNIPSIAHGRPILPSPGKQPFLPPLTNPNRRRVFAGTPAARRQINLATDHQPVRGRRRRGKHPRPASTQCIFYFVTSYELMAVRAVHVSPKPPRHTARTKKRRPHKCGRQRGGDCESGRQNFKRAPNCTRQRDWPLS